MNTALPPELSTRPPGAAAAVGMRTLAHIGNMKTGSTAVQMVLRDLRGELAARGVIMPGLVPGDIAHYGIRHDVAEGGAQPFLQRMRSDIAAAPKGSRALVTAEPLIGLAPEEVAQALAQAGCADVTLLCYVRPQIAMMGGLYLQTVKTGFRRGPVSDYLEMLGHAPVQFMAALDGFARVFGEDRILVREYNPAALIGGSVVADFWDMAGLPPDLRAKALALETRANPTPKAEVALLMRSLATRVLAEAPEEERASALRNYVLSSISASMRQIWSVVAEHSPRMGGRPYRLPLYMQEAMDAHFAPQRADFARRWFRAAPTEAWLHESVIAPEPLVDLAALPVTEALEASVVKLNAQGKAGIAASVTGFLRDLPIRGDQLSIAALAEPLAPEAPPVDLKPYLCL